MCASRKSVLFNIVNAVLNLVHFLNILVVILGTLGKLRKATISFVMSVRPPVRMEELCSHWKDFDETWDIWFFS